MLNWVSAIAFLLIIAACSEAPEKVVDLSEKIPKSSRNYDVVDTNSIDSSQLIAFPYASMFPALKRSEILESRSFIDRFRPKTSEKFVIYQVQAEPIQFMRWGFKDSVKTKNAFYNWMDHEGIPYFGAHENIQGNAVSMLYCDTAIVIVTGGIDLKNWRKMLEEKKWLHDGDCLIEQRKNSKANWFRWKSDEFKEITEE